MRQSINDVAVQTDQGFIHSIESGSSVDGPGIRSVIFLQGCPLRCKYCQNPDTWNLSDGKVQNVDHIVKKLLSYKSFYDSSGGGVTISGGEPLMQKKFLASLLKELKQNNIHTALDTSGFTDINEDLDNVLKYTDLVLLDIKHLSDNKHIYLTGKSNNKTLNLLNYLNKRNIKTWIRYVLLKTINDSDDYVAKLANYLKGYKNVELVEVLPYHRLGLTKWKELGLDYPLKDIASSTNQDAIKVKKILSKYGLKTI